MFICMFLQKYSFLENIKSSTLNKLAYLQIIRQLLISEAKINKDVR